MIGEPEHFVDRLLTVKFFNELAVLAEQDAYRSIPELRGSLINRAVSNVVEVLTQALRRPDDGVRASAASFFGDAVNASRRYCGGAADREILAAKPSLIRALADSSDQVRLNVVNSLREFVDRDAFDIASALTRTATTDKSSEISVASLRVLQSCGVDLIATSVTALVECLSEVKTKPAVKIAICDLLSSVPKEATPAMAALFHMATCDSNDALRLAATKSLAALRPSKSQINNSVNDDNRETLLASLARIGRSGRRLARSVRRTSSKRDGMPDSRMQESPLSGEEQKRGAQTSGNKKCKLTLGEADFGTREHLTKNQNATLREIAAALGCSPSLIAKTISWKFVMSFREEEKVKTPKAVGLSDAVLNNAGKNDEMLKRLMDESNKDNESDPSPLVDDPPDAPRRPRERKRV